MLVFVRAIGAIQVVRKIVSVMPSFNFGGLLPLILAVCWWAAKTEGVSFESCADSPFTGNCTVITGDGCLASESVNSVRIENGSLNYGPLGGCPYQNNTCPDGFAYYGWIKFLAFPRQCNEYHVAVSTQVFNIHLLGNGHLATYAWLPNGTEYYGESISPMLLDTWIPIVVEFKRFAENGTYRLILVVNDQLVGGCDKGRTRTYTPPIPNLLFGGNGVSNNCSGNMQFDRNNFGPPATIETYYGTLFNVPLRQSNCNIRGGILIRPLTCYYGVTATPLNWTQANDQCKANAFADGYPYGRLASIPNDNATDFFNALAPKLASYGNGTATGYTAWMSGGSQFQWLASGMAPSGGMVVIPTSTVKNSTGSSSSTCLFIDTKPWPWQWAEMPCSTQTRYICQMSYDCVMNNPCKNQGTCLPINDGQTICKCYGGTSGKYCEEGTIQPACINNCTCSFPTCGSAPGPPVGNTTTVNKGNCSACIENGRFLLPLIQRFVNNLKLILPDVGADGDMTDSWQCDTRSSYSSMVKGLFNYDTPNISNNFDDISISFECSTLLEMYVKILFYGKVYRKLLKYYLKRNSVLPVEMSSMWTTINSATTAFTYLPCYIDHVKPKLQRCQHVVYWCNRDDGDDGDLDGRYDNGRGVDVGTEAGC